jgi:hypothetical protein
VRSQAAINSGSAICSDRLAIESNDRLAIESNDRFSAILKYLEQNGSGKNADFVSLLAASHD